MKAQAQTFNAVVFGDAPQAFDFSPSSENELHQLAFAIRRDFLDKETEITSQVVKQFPVKINFRERRTEGKEAYEAEKARRFQEAGISEGENFYQTPMGRVEWQYQGTKMGDPNWADTDRSTFVFTLTKF